MIKVVGLITNSYLKTNLINVQTGLFTNVNKHPLDVNHIGNPIKSDDGWSLPELRELAGARHQKETVPSPTVL